MVQVERNWFRARYAVVVRRWSDQATGSASIVGSLVRVWGDVSGPAIYRDASTMRLVIYTDVIVVPLSPDLFGTVVVVAAVTMIL
jgi:hypothetical protein